MSTTTSLTPKTLGGATTGLPWNTGVVQTAKCDVCKEKTKEMWRRCADCAHIKCVKCHNRTGFKHYCSSIDQETPGPFPTHAQESAVLAVFGAAIPDRDASKAERAPHDGTWTWTAPLAVIARFPGIHLDAANTIVTSNPEVLSAPPLVITPTPSKTAKTPKTPKTKRASATPTPTPSKASTSRATPAKASPSKPAATKPEASKVDSKAVSMPPPSLGSMLPSVAQPGAARGGRRGTNLWDAHLQVEEDKAEDEVEGIEMEEAQELGENAIEDEADAAYEDEDGHGVTSQVESDFKIAKKLAGDVPQTLASSRSRRESGKRKPSATEAIEPSPKKAKTSKSKAEGDLARADTARFNKNLEETLLPKFDAPAAFAKESGIRGKRVLTLDTRGVDEITITLFPGMQFRDPTSAHNNATTAEDSPIAMPGQLYYQFPNKDTGRIERHTVATLEAGSPHLDVPAKADVAHASLDDKGRAIPQSFHDWFIRATTGNPLGGDTSGLMRDSAPYVRETYEDDEE